VTKARKSANSLHYFCCYARQTRIRVDFSTGQQLSGESQWFVPNVNLVLYPRFRPRSGSIVTHHVPSAIRPCRLPRTFRFVLIAAGLNSRFLRPGYRRAGYGRQARCQSQAPPQEFLKFGVAPRREVAVSGSRRDSTSRSAVHALQKRAANTKKAPSRSWRPFVLAFCAAPRGYSAAAWTCSPRGPRRQVRVAGVV
jgi:hypothetical protein